MARPPRRTDSRRVTLTERSEDFKYIVRLANTDLPGEGRLAHTLPRIRGLGYRVGRILARQCGLDPEQVLGELDDDAVARLEEAVADVSANMPGWMVNRPRDYDTGSDHHLLGIDLKLVLEDDINRMKKIKCYRGLRHASGHKVRGQRTYSNGRRGLALGVSRKKK